MKMNKAKQYQISCRKKLNHSLKTASRGSECIGGHDMASRLGFRRSRYLPRHTSYVYVSRSYLSASL